MFLDFFWLWISTLSSRSWGTPERTFVRKINLLLAFHFILITQFLEPYELLIPYILLVHDQDRSESYFPAHHMLICLLCVFQRERLNQTFNIMKLGEINGLFAVKRMTRRVSSYRSSFLDQVSGVDLDHTAWGQYE